MTKQGKIDWGLRNLITEWTSEEGSKYLYDFSNAIRTYLHSQGVVIKVDRELPSMDIVQALEADIADRRGLKSEWYMIDNEVMAELKAAWMRIIKEVLAGYVAVEPLAD